MLRSALWRRISVAIVIALLVPSFMAIPNRYSSPASAQENCQYFSETRYNLCDGFREYWHSHGLDFGDPGFSDRESLALFGYPISGEFQANGVTTQYFERARFEYHPENEPPYDILLGLLGNEIAAGRRAAGERPFQPIWNGSSNENCNYYSETGHWLCFGMRSYWEQNGGLPTFGFPISEEFDEVNPDDGKVYTVQYFERQRLEWHPENRGTPYEVLLGRVGAQIAAAGSPIVSQRISAKAGGTIAYGDQLSIEFPPNALSEDTLVTVRPLDSSAGPSLPSGMSTIGSGFDISLGSSTLTSPATVHLAYDARASFQSSESNPSFFIMASTVDGLWTPVTGAVDSVTHGITAQLPYLGKLLPTMIDWEAWIQNALRLNIQNLVNTRVNIATCHDSLGGISVTNQQSSPIWGCVVTESPSAKVSVTNRTAFGLNVRSNSDNTDQIPNHRFLAPGEAYQFSVNTARNDSPVKLIPEYTEAAFLRYVGQLYLSVLLSVLPIDKADLVGDALLDPVTRATVVAAMVPGLSKYGHEMWQQVQAEDWQGATNTFLKMYLDHNVLEAEIQVLEKYGVNQAVISWLEWSISALAGITAIPGTLVAIIQSATSQILAVADGSFNHAHVAFSWTPHTSSPSPSAAPVPSPPAAPTNVRATATGPTSIQIDWQDNSNNEDGFRVQDGSLPIHTVGRNSTSYTDNSVQPGSYHCYHVQAFNSAGASAWSDWSCTTTSATKTASVVVPSTAQWVNTGLHVRAGDQIRITASGSWYPGQPETAGVGPNGSSTAWADNFLNTTDLGVCAYCASHATPHWAALIGYIGSNPPGPGSYAGEGAGYSSVESTPVESTPEAVAQYSVYVPPAYSEAQKVFFVGGNYHAYASSEGTLWLNFNDAAYSGVTSDNWGQVTASITVTS